MSMTAAEAKARRESPATPSLAYETMLPAWNKVQTVLNGTDAMRAAGKSYLPQHDNESNSAYKERLERCTLLNLTKITLESWVGRPFSDPIVFSDDQPTQVEDLLEDIDLQGSSLQVFARDWFSDGLAKALSHVYVDFPRVDVPEDGSPRTLADDDAEGVRPYWVHIRPEQLFFADAETEGGREILREIRIMEEVVERDGMAETFVEQIRRVYLNDQLDESGARIRNLVVELWRVVKSNRKKKVWEIVEDYTADIPVIPLVTFYSNRDAFMHGVPPLKDLADLNIAHWQSTSDQRAILTVARFPMLALSGGIDEDANGEGLVIGPHRWLHTIDPQGKFYYVEHEGKAIAAGRMDIESLETQMSEYGAAFLKKNPGNPTATARALDSAEATSSLQDVTIRFADAITEALQFTADWMGQEHGGVATLTTDFGPEDVDGAGLTALEKSRAMGDISRKAHLTELKRLGLLSEDYDIEADAEELANEAMDQLPLVTEPVVDDPEKKEPEESPEMDEE